MCLAIPGTIVSIKDGFADVNYSGLRKNASLRLFPNAVLGDHVLVHAGFVIQILDPDEGSELEKIVAEMMETMESNEL
ncbi:MAG: HypC/HybG/HupF family hydrogenase formation chaperone [Thermoclostridium sp.]|nr:HypC/HybG/HupF family hydrogenase formation chaperone [Thermoclostridium sp.]